MVWTESPTSISATTETIDDIENDLLECSPCISPAHPIEHGNSTHVSIIPSSPYALPIHEEGPLRPNLAYADFYIEIFVKLAQG